MYISRNSTHFPEQLALVLKYVDINTATQHKRFLTYVKAKSQDAESLSEYILDKLKQCGLSPADIVSQGYDGDWEMLWSANLY